MWLRMRNVPCPSAIAWCSAVWPAESVALMGLRCLIRSVSMGTEPTAAARCSGYCPRLSRTRVEAAGVCDSSSLRARSRLLLEARKCRAVWERLVMGWARCGERGSYLAVVIWRSWLV